ncbi:MULTISPECIES: hypothetical protein [unclassified Bradyrhizobium]|nr:MULTISPECIES: hypothetical protein [unclassified Bradyrhizobium]
MLFVFWSWSNQELCMMQLNSDVEPESSGCLTNSGRQERLAA